MKRKNYMKPEINTEPLEEQSHILIVSQARNAGVEDYTWHDEEEE